MSVVFLGPITILFGGIVEETSTAMKVGRIVGRATGRSIFTQKSLRHGQFGYKRVGNRFSIGEGASRNVHVAGLLGNVAGSGAPGIQTAIQGTKGGFLVNCLCISAGWIELSACRKYHILGWHGSRNGRCAGDVLFADLYQGTEILW